MTIRLYNNRIVMKTIKLILINVEKVCLKNNIKSYFISYINLKLMFVQYKKSTKYNIVIRFIWKLMFVIIIYTLQSCRLEKGKTILLHTLFYRISHYKV